MYRLIISQKNANIQEVIDGVDQFLEIAYISHVETVVLLNNKFAKAKDFVQIGIDAEDYYRIKDSEKDTDE